MSDWRKKATKDIRSLWPGEAPTESRSIASATRECIEFQLRIGTWGIILPGPLTADPMSDYSHELEWLDAGLAHLSTIKDFSHPVFATVAISDVALRRYTVPKKNPLLDVVLDQVSARGVDGVYIVIEQSAERDDTRECSSPRTLRSLLYLVHRFSQESDIQVGVNFIGAFALACEAAGAAWWASNWYKSLRRVRLADSLAAGRVYPQFWSAPAALDINLESDFDRLAKAGLSRIADTTPASAGLLQAAQRGVSANSLPAWRYTQSNVKAPIEHYLHSSMQMEAAHAAQGAGRPRLDHVESWLASADATATWAISQLGRSLKTKVDHVSYWLEAFHFYRRDHNV